jgi:hypothetical protein
MEVRMSKKDVSTAVTTLDESIRRELLAAQAEALTGSRPPKVKVMPQGVNLFEFEDEPGTTVQSLTGVVVHYHGANVLWDKPFGAPRNENEPPLPACGSPDGKYGRPREGFTHAMLTEPSEGTERVSCATCVYNEWESAAMIGKRGKGKACTNQQALYLLLTGRDIPVELILSPTSLNGWMEYVKTLTAKRLPVQAVVTTFGLERKEGTQGLRWSQVTFTKGESLDVDGFNSIMALRKAIMDVLSGVAATEQPTGEEISAEESDAPPF